MCYCLIGWSGKGCKADKSWVTFYVMALAVLLEMGCTGTRWKTADPARDDCERDQGDGRSSDQL